MKKIFLIFLLLPFLSFSQIEVKGLVTEEINGIETPIVGANVYWSGTTIGAISNEKGEFVIPFTAKNKFLVFSYIGYQEKIITVTKAGIVNVNLIESNDLDTVVVTAESKATTISLLDSRNIVTLSSKELLKAACCNLSESFETLLSSRNLKWE